MNLNVCRYEVVCKPCTWMTLSDLTGEDLLHPAFLNLKRYLLL